MHRKTLRKIDCGISNLRERPKKNISIFDPLKLFAHAISWGGGPAFRLMDILFVSSPLPFRGHLPSCHGSVFDFHAYFTEGCRSIDDYHMIMGSFADFSDFRIFGNPFQSGFMAVQIQDRKEKWNRYQISLTFILNLQNTIS